MNLLDLSSMHLERGKEIADVIDFADLSNTVYISISLCFIQSNVLYRYSCSDPECICFI